jgi:hypothetical protein
VAGGGFLGKEAVEASQWAVVWDGWVVVAIVARVVFTLEVPALAADPAALICCWVMGACVCVMCEQETVATLSVLYVGCGKLYCVSLSCTCSTGLTVCS